MMNGLEHWTVAHATLVPVRVKGIDEPEQTTV